MCIYLHIKKENIIIDTIYKYLIFNFKWQPFNKLSINREDSCIHLHYSHKFSVYSIDRRVYFVLYKSNHEVFNRSYIYEYAHISHCL